MFKKSLYLIKLIPKLGYWNVLYIFWYRVSIKLNIRKRKFPVGKEREGPFFSESPQVKNYPEAWRPRLQEKVSDIASGKLTWFNFHAFEVGNPPNWFYNPFLGTTLEHKGHWLEVSEFKLDTGDIKITWELSRFDWITDLARGYKVFGDLAYLKLMNKWLEDWSAHNPLNLGPNWKCGQEASFRLMKLLDASFILSQENEMLPGLHDLVYDHLERISGNIRYAVAQNNNHGTSESAALYIGAVWLLNQRSSEDFNERKKIEAWRKEGRKILEKRITKLIAKDGTFSQKSTNYHRVVVDTMSWVLGYMEQYHEPHFSGDIITKLEHLGTWQYKVIIKKNGKVPNIGSNDGAMINNLHGCDYRDFRPSTQVFSSLIFGKKSFTEGPWDETLFWYNKDILLTPSNDFLIPDYEVLDDQFLIMRKGEIEVFLKIPNGPFRQGNDPFHIDVWYKGENVLMDTGSYSYNSNISSSFKSINYHNSVQFGNMEPLPQISRFLNAEWIQVGPVEKPRKNGQVLEWRGKYKDYRNNVHEREVTITSKEIVIIDKVTTKGNAVFNLHFGPMICQSEDKEIFLLEEPQATVIVKGAKEIFQKSAWHSLYYMQKEEHTKLTGEFAGDSIITTIKFK